MHVVYIDVINCYNIPYSGMTPIKIKKETLVLTQYRTGYLTNAGRSILTYFFQQNT